MGNQTALVTGSSTGIGEATVKRLAESGWRVYAGVRRDEDGERLVQEISGDVVPVRLDVTDHASIGAAVQLVRDEGGLLHGVVNNAGIAVGGPIEIVEVDDWRNQFDVNVLGVVAVTRATFPLVDAADGRFVHIGSIAGRVASPGLGPYSGSKHAIEAFNWALRAELKQIGRMNSSVVEPGEIKTAIWDKAEGELAEMETTLADAGKTARYQWMLESFIGFLAEANEKAIDPDRVADAVMHALTAKRPKARYLVGTDAKIQAAIARLPDRGREFVLAQAGAMYIKNGKKLRAG